RAYERAATSALHSVHTVSHDTRSFFSVHDPATTQIYTLSLHDALPISRPRRLARLVPYEPMMILSRGRLHIHQNGNHSAINELLPTCGGVVISSRRHRPASRSTRCRDISSM